jgi:hypothetical protein
MSGVGVTSATSPGLAAAAVVELSRMRWEPARLRGIAVDTSVTIEMRFQAELQQHGRRVLPSVVSPPLSFELQSKTRIRILCDAKRKQRR